MVVNESYVTRKPLEFTLLVLFIVLLVLTPVYLFTRPGKTQPAEKVMINESFNELLYRFGPESDLSGDDKRILFRLEYEGSIAQWSGRFMSCQKIGALNRVSVEHLGTEFADVVFTTEEDCSDLVPGQPIDYRMELVDWKTTTFVGKHGELIR